MSIVSIVDQRPERNRTFRFYRPEDKDAVLEVFKRQGLKVALPLPGEDAATAIGVVAEEDGVIKEAIFFRTTYELHLVADNHTTPYTIRRMGAIAEGAAMQAGVELAKLRFSVPNDVIAFVPKAMPRMIDFMRQYLGFIDEATDEFHMLVKRIGS